MPTFTTVDKYGTWRAKPDEDQPDDEMVRAANKAVEKAVRNDMYATDPNGIATEPVFSEAMERAANIQLLAWVKEGITGDALLLGGNLSAEPDVTSTKIGSGAVTINDGRAQSARVALYSQLVPSAFDELRSVGLGSATVGGQGALW